MSSTIASRVMPKAKAKDIVVQEVGDETLVYDMAKDKAHHLNRTLSLIWKNCDGKSTFMEVAELLSKDTETEVKDDFVWLGVIELNKANLLADADSLLNFPALSRRKVLFRYALPTVALPIVVSLVAPRSTHAQSCGGLGQLNDPCNSNPDCCPPLVCVLFIGDAFAGMCGPPPPPP